MTVPTADLGALLRRSFQRHSDSIAVEDGPRTLTFAELDRRSDRLANALLERNPERRPVAILARNRLEYIEIDIALIKVGQPKVPINPRLTQDERLHIVRDSGATVILTEDSLSADAGELVDQAEDLRIVITIDGAGVDDYETVLAGARGTPPVREWLPDDPSVILYTSGTTGRPKGATATFRTRMAATWTMLLDELTDVSPGDGMLHVGPLSHGSGSKVVAYALSGARNILVPSFDPEGFLDEVERRQATASFVVPTMITMLTEAAGDRNPPASLRHVSYGGAPIAPATLRRALDTFGPIFVQVFGTAEAPHPLTVLTRADHIDASDARLASAGRPTRAVELRLVPTENGEPGTGEIQVRAESVMRGYWNNPEATREAFSDGFYRTGDIGRMDDDGYLSIVDREKDMVISGGLNVYPAEVEAVLARHPAVLETAVIGIPDDRWGELVAAYVVARPGHSLSEDEVAEHVARHLAGYKKPRRVWIVEDLPKGSTGKVLKSELRKAHWAAADRGVN